MGKTLLEIGHTPLNGIAVLKQAAADSDNPM